MGDTAITIIVAFLAALPGLLALIAQRRKDKVDIAEKLEGMASRLQGRIEGLQERIDELETEKITRTKEIETLRIEIDSLNRSIAEWKAGVALLINQLIANGHTPVWKPREAKG